MPAGALGPDAADRTGGGREEGMPAGRCPLLPFVMSPFPHAMAAFLSNPVGTGRGRRVAGQGRRAGDHRGGIGGAATCPGGAWPRADGAEEERERGRAAVTRLLAQGRGCWLHSLTPGSAPGRLVTLGGVSGMGSVKWMSPGPPESRPPARFRRRSLRRKSVLLAERAEGPVQLFGGALFPDRICLPLWKMKIRWAVRGEGRGSGAGREAGAQRAAGWCFSQNCCRTCKCKLDLRKTRFFSDLFGISSLILIWGHFQTFSYEVGSLKYICQWWLQN